MKQGLYGTTQNVDSRVRYHFQFIQSPKPVSEEESQNEVVVESGPVEYEKSDENTQEFDELEEEEEGEPVSVTQLMGHIYDGGKLLPFFSVSRALRSEHTRRQVAVTRLSNRSLLCTGRATSCGITLRRHVAATSRFVCTRILLLQQVAKKQIRLNLCDLLGLQNSPLCFLLPITTVTRYRA